MARAYALSKDTALLDSPQMQAARAKYAGFPNAQKPPFVLVGDVHRLLPVLARRAHDPVGQRLDEALDEKGQGQLRYDSDGGPQGYAAALTELAGLGKVDFQRVLVLRTASNYCMPPPNETAVSSLEAGFVGYIPSVESAYRVGSVVVHDILANWDRTYAGGVK